MASSRCAFCQVELLEARKGVLGLLDQPLSSEFHAHCGRDSLGFSMRRRDDQGALLFLERSDVQITDRLNPFVGLFDFPDHAKPIQLVEAFLGLALRQILIAALKAGICCRKILLSAALATTANFSRIRSASPRSTEWCCRQSRHYENTNSHSNCCLRHLYLCGCRNRQAQRACVIPGTSSPFQVAQYADSQAKVEAEPARANPAAKQRAIYAERNRAIKRTIDVELPIGRVLSAARALETVAISSGSFLLWSPQH